MLAACTDAAGVGVTVTAASGDDGATDGVSDKKLHVDLPASCHPCWPAAAHDWTAARGRSPARRSGTNWQRTRARPVEESAGSLRFRVIKAKAGVPVHPETKFAGRGVPDVSGDADPVTGYQVRVDGQN